MKGLTENPVGKKLIMATTGLLLLGFLVVHLIGNSTIFVGPNGINAYAKGLHSIPPFVWTFRILLLLLFITHVYFGIKLTFQNRQAKPQGYAINKQLSSTFSSRTMIWTGLVVLVFVVYHLLHFTFQITSVPVRSYEHFDHFNRPDVFRMVITSFQDLSVVILYTGGLTALMLHLLHGIQSLFQTVGLNNDSLMPKVKTFGYLLAIVVFVAYLAIPAVIVTGLLKA